MIASLVRKEIEHLRKELESKAVESNQVKTNLELTLEKLGAESLYPPIVAKISEKDESPNLANK